MRDLLNRFLNHIAYHNKTYLHRTKHGYDIPVSDGDITMFIEDFVSDEME